MNSLNSICVYLYNICSSTICKKSAQGEIVRNIIQHSSPPPLPLPSPCPEQIYKYNLNERPMQSCS